MPSSSAALRFRPNPILTLVLSIPRGLAFPLPVGVATADSDPDIRANAGFIMLAGGAGDPSVDFAAGGTIPGARKELAAAKAVMSTCMMGV